MAKVSPEKRWRRLILERFTALELSGELKKLQAEGLAILKRKKLFTPEEWWQTFSQRAHSQEYRAWYDKCKTLGERFGLAQWTVSMACLLKGYDPEKQPHVLESEWPQVRVITESSDPLFLARLAYEAQILGLRVVQRCGSEETTYLYLNPVPIDSIEPPPLPSPMPPFHNAFRMRLETPTGYPPKAVNELQKEAGLLAKELMKHLGYSIPQRLRSSKLVSMADELRIAEAHLPKRGLYEIVADTFDEGSESEDEQRRKTVKTQRHRLRKRLVKAYEASDSENK